MKKMISVVIPTKNMEKYIEKCLDSVLASKNVLMEIIVVDFGSKDKTVDILNEYSERWSCIHIYKDQNGNAASARNKGIKYSSGDYLAFLDADDWYEEDFLDKLYMYMESQELDIISCGYKQVYEESNNMVLHKWTNREVNINLNNLNKEVCQLMNGNINLEVWNKLYRMSFIKENNIYFDDTKGINGEDIYFNVIAFMNCPRLLIIEDCLYYHLIRMNSLANTKKVQLTERFITIIELLYQYSLSQKCVLEDVISILTTNLIIQDLGRDKSCSSIRKKIEDYRNNSIVMKVLNSSLYSNQINVKQKCFNVLIIHNIIFVILFYVKKCL